MTTNPEYRRNLWLEITPTRLAGMPLVLGAAFFMAWLSDDHGFGSSVSGTALALFVAITFLWGTRQASESVLGEVRERTWDWQRMSAIDPWTLAWGKLLGSTVYTWYGGAICLAFLAISRNDASTVPTPKAVLALALGALLMQSFAFLGSLQMLVRERSSLRTGSSAMLLLAFFFASPMFSFFSLKGTVHWFGLEFPQIDFLICSLAIFTVWMLIGACSLIRAEFRMRRPPYAWGGFMLFMMCYVPGFVGPLDGKEGVAPHLIVAFVTAIAITYLSAFLDRKDPVVIAKLLQWRREGAWEKLVEGLPCWILSLPFVLCAAVAQLIMPQAPQLQAGGTAARAVILSCTLLLLRDLALLLFLNLGKRPQRADMFLILCLSILYGLLPGILNIMHAPQATALFWPRTDYWGVSLAASCVEAAIMWRLLSQRWAELRQPRL